MCSQKILELCRGNQKKYWNQLSQGMNNKNYSKCRITRTGFAHSARLYEKLSSTLQGLFDFFSVFWRS
jgi:CDP-diacylglycerol pyrophosphatase